MNALGLVTLLPDGHKACVTALSSASPHRSKENLISSFSAFHNTLVMCLRVLNNQEPLRGLNI